MLKSIKFNQLGKAGYNRGIMRSHVNEIKENFDEAMVQPAIVSFRDGKYWIIDHQHQTQAIYERNGNDPNTPIQCDVRTGLTYEQEAELYYKLNTSQKPLKFNDKIIGLIEAKDERALEFRDIIESCGYIVGGGAKNSVKSLSTAWHIFIKKGGVERLKCLLSISHESWPNDDAGVQKTLLDGLNLFIDNHEQEYKREHLVEALSNQEPSALIRQSRTYYKQMNARSFTQPYCTYTMVMNAYNTGLRSKLKLKEPAV